MHRGIFHHAIRRLNTDEPDIGFECFRQGREVPPRESG
jgi:hypothetical protein